MNTTLSTISGYVVALPRNVDNHQAIVAIVYNDVEYRVLPKGAGIDLDDEVNALVEATGTISEEDDIHYITVRSYKVVDGEDDWEDE